MSLIEVSPATDPQRAAAIKARLFGNPRAPEPVRVVVSEIPEPVKPPRLVQAWTVQQDCHVTAWRMASYETRIKSLEMTLRNKEDLINRMVGESELPSVPRISALDVCKATLARCAANGEGNFTMSEILGLRRGREVVRVRHKCMAEVVRTCTHLSYPQIGRFFNRDHSSIMWAAQKFGARR